jgi:hypothetical protein
MILCWLRADQNVSSVDLRVGEFYKVISDPISDDNGFVRVVDGSGEDYLYPVAFFEFFIAEKIDPPDPVVPKVRRHHSNTMFNPKLPVNGIVNEM